MNKRSGVYPAVRVDASGSGVFGSVASDPTVSRTIAGLAADGPRALAAINTARAAARAWAWALAGDKAPDHGTCSDRPLVIDPTWLKLVRTAGSVDQGEGVA